jgi:hypothetical protein
MAGDEGGGSEGAQLEDIEVRPQADSPLSGDGTGSGSYRFDRDYLERFGGLGGSLEGVLQLVPNLQFGEGALSPDALSDLRPESYSISGGRAYENQILLDGMSISNRIDPSADNPNAIGNVPGHEQSQFIDSRLIGEMRVFDTNVPAAYGDFTGGVVDMETRRAGPEPEGSVSYGTTRSDWVSYRTFTEDWDPSTGGLPPEPPSEPEFRRERITFDYSTPVGEASGLVVGLSQQESKTPLISLGKTRSQQQLNRNGMLKFSTPLGADSFLDVQGTYAPFRSEQLIKDARSSAFTVTGGGMGLNAKVETIGVTMDQTWELGLNYSENSRRAPKDFFNWANTRSRDWGRRADVGTSREGGFGDLDKYQASATGKWQAETVRGRWGPVGVRHRFGTNLSHSRYRFHRDETLFVFQDAKVNSQVQCRSRTYDCVQEEQYFSTRKVYPADDVEVALNEGSLFGETTFSYRYLTATVGLRYSYDDFLRNHDLAYRTRATLDFFGDRSTVLRLGFNRYYGAPLLTYKLREAREPYHTEYRGTQQNVVEEWERGSGQGNYRYVFEDLDTPYSDERMIGLEQNLLGGRLRFQVVQRNNRDEFARTTTPVQPDGYRHYRMTNQGGSDYLGISASWFAEFGATRLTLSTTYSETTTTNATYDDPVEGTQASEFIYYDGERIRYGQLDILRENFARPWVANVGLSHRFGDRLTLSLNNRYRSRYTNIVPSGETRQGRQVPNDSGGTTYEQLEVYEDVQRPATVISDLKVTYSQPIVASHTIIAQVQVNNLFDQRTHTVLEGQSGVETGRNFWVNLRYGF